MFRMPQLNRRRFLCSAAFATASLVQSIGHTAETEEIIDIHQHTSYHGRSDSDLIQHQRRMGVTQTVLLPSGKHYGLDAECGGNDSVRALAEKHPGEFLFFANELPYDKQARAIITRFLKAGAKGIGEQKFRVLADSSYLALIAGIAAEFGVPVLLHFQDGDYNMELQRFTRLLQKFPQVNFIGHAQTWWAHIDAAYDGKSLYPKGRVKAGGLTDKLLSDYPNLYADLSAASGLNALNRDEEHTRAFFTRHQDKLLFGSDCADSDGHGSKCTGAQILEVVRNLSADAAIRRKILAGNARRVLKLTSSPAGTASEPGAAQEKNNR
jgi:predicted TIM-barrel fold metal-dependent hydrolase